METRTCFLVTLIRARSRPTAIGLRHADRDGGTPFVVDAGRGVSDSPLELVGSPTPSRDIGGAGGGGSPLPVDVLGAPRALDLDVVDEPGGGWPQRPGHGERCGDGAGARKDVHGDLDGPGGGGVPVFVVVVARPGELH